ncbi:hypothetical protein SAMN04515695_1966 [Pseudovibrio sp. Tun.PSC04-5.I4]|nr:hypothetical protein SAMN04515695_1966 [Pseudovibrio sp. Tun.PSC04-5.I4]
MGGRAGPVFLNLNSLAIHVQRFLRGEKVIYCILEMQSKGFTDQQITPRSFCAVSRIPWPLP